MPNGPDVYKNHNLSLGYPYGTALSRFLVFIVPVRLSPVAYLRVCCATYHPTYCQATIDKTRFGQRPVAARVHGIGCC